MELEILQSINISNRKALSASTSTFNLDNQQQQPTTTTTILTNLGPELSERLSQLGNSAWVFRLGRREFGRLRAGFG